MPGTVSTQVVQQATNQTFTAQYVNDMSTVDQYKTLLNQIYQVRIGLISQIKSLMSEIENMKAGHANLLEQFKQKALAMYPQYQGQDLKAIIANLASTDPLVQLWQTTSQNVNDVRNAIAQKTMQLSALVDQDNAQADNQTKTLASYDSFSKGTSTAVPTSAQLVSSLPALSPIPAATEASVIASLPAIEELDPEAAALVTLQVADQLPVNLAVSQQDTTPAGTAIINTQSKISELLSHPIVKYGGTALAVIYFLGGGKNRQG